MEKWETDTRAEHTDREVAEVKNVNWCDKQGWGITGKGRKQSNSRQHGCTRKVCAWQGEKEEEGGKENGNHHDPNSWKLYDSIQISKFPPLDRTVWFSTSSSRDPGLFSEQRTETGGEETGNTWVCIPRSVPLSTTSPQHCQIHAVTHIQTTPEGLLLSSKESITDRRWRDFSERSCTAKRCHLVSVKQRGEPDFLGFALIITLSTAVSFPLTLSPLFSCVTTLPCLSVSLSLSHWVMPSPWIKRGWRKRQKETREMSNLNEATTYSTTVGPTPYLVLFCGRRLWGNVTDGSGMP